MPQIIPSSLNPVGYEQIILTSKAQALAPPTDATYALVQIEEGSIRWRDDGVDPTPEEGMLLRAGFESQFSGQDLAKVRVIQAAGATEAPEGRAETRSEERAKINISYYRA